MLCNNIDKLDSRVSFINDIVPEAKVRYAHGRMSKDEIEDVMSDFINHEFDILLCTTIIETGIDLYLKMLKEEVDKLKGLKVEEEDTNIKPLIEVETHITNEYAPDDEIKIEIHKLINDINSEEDIINLKNVLEDRFGTVTN